MQNEQPDSLESPGFSRGEKSTVQEKNGKQ